MSIAVSAINWGWSKQAVYERAAYERTAEYQQYAYHPALRRCIGVPTASQADCIADARKAERENARAESDLEAQRITALWTYIMGGAAITGMLLSAIGVGLIWTTFRETKRSADTAISNLEIYRSTERAHVKVADARLLVRHGHGVLNFGLEIGFLNTGKSFAEIYSITGFKSDSIEWEDAGHDRINVERIFCENGKIEYKDWASFNKVDNPSGDVYMGVAQYRTLGSDDNRCYFCVVVNVDDRNQLTIKLVNNAGLPEDT
jgi:hypothetical protein